MLFNLALDVVVDELIESRDQGNEIVLLRGCREKFAVAPQKAKEIIGILCQLGETVCSHLPSVNFHDGFPRHTHNLSVAVNHYGYGMIFRQSEEFIDRVENLL